MNLIVTFLNLLLLHEMKYFSSHIYRYFGHPRPTTSEIDVLQWWKTNRDLFPILADMARQVLCIPVSSSSSERVFSTAGQILSDLRQNMSTSLTTKIVFIKKNFGKLDTDLAKWSYKVRAEMEELKVNRCGGSGT